MAKVTIQLGDEVEFLTDCFRITIGKLKSFNIVELHRERGRQETDNRGHLREIPGQVVTIAAQLGFDVLAGHFVLTPADSQSTIPPAASVENSQHIANNTENT